MTLGTTIRKLRKQRGLTLLELATMIESDVGNLSRLERDQQGYSDALLKKIAAALDVSVGALFADESAGAPVITNLPNRKVQRAHDGVIGVARLAVLYHDLPADLQRQLLEYAEDLQMQDQNRKLDAEVNEKQQSSIKRIN
jgi:transcriptional regulator with XRE-family HTH domain